MMLALSRARLRRYVTGCAIVAVGIELDEVPRELRDLQPETLVSDRRTRGRNPEERNSEALFLARSAAL